MSYSPNKKEEGQMPHCTNQDKQSLSTLHRETKTHRYLVPKIWQQQNGKKTSP